MNIKVLDNINSAKDYKNIENFFKAYASEHGVSIEELYKIEDPNLKLKEGAYLTFFGSHIILPSEDGERKGLAYILALCDDAIGLYCYDRVKCVKVAPCKYEAINPLGLNAFLCTKDMKHDVYDGMSLVASFRGSIRIVDYDIVSDIKLVVLVHVESAKIVCVQLVNYDKYSLCFDKVLFKEDFENLLCELDKNNQMTKDYFYQIKELGRNIFCDFK